MSTFFAELVQCPHCGEITEQSVAHSINASRSPQYRESILRGSFQRYICSVCQNDYLVDRPFIYLDYHRKDWIGVFPINEEIGWQQWEQKTSESYKFACGENAPKVAQEIGKDMKLRTVFGLAALREKLLCFQHGLEDVLIELLKLNIMIESGQLALSNTNPLRLVEVEDTTLWLIYEQSQQYTELVPITRQCYNKMENNHEYWSSLIGELSRDSFVDISRLKTT